MQAIARITAWLFIASTSSYAMESDRVGDFALLDSQGVFHKMSYYDDHKAIAFLVQSNFGTVTEPTVTAFSVLHSKHKDQVKFFIISPSSATRAEVQEWSKLQNPDLRVLMDDTQLVSKAMKAETAGQAILLDSKSFEVRYRGPVDTNFANAIVSLLAGKPVKQVITKLKGEKIAYAKVIDSKNAASYVKDIAPIIAENCARCHRTGGVGPFAMNSHAVVQGFAPMIREVVMTKRMPPGQIDPYIGHFKNTYTLTPLQTQKLIGWINTGAKKDGTTDPLSELKWPESKWTLGEPDLIVKVPPQSIPATGVLPLRDVLVPIDGLRRDRYVRASEYLAGDSTALHHTVTGVIPPEAAGTPSAGIAGSLDTARIAAYIPGTQPLIEPANTGGLLRKGSSLSLNLHYTTTGRATTDAGEIGVWFYPDDKIPTERMSIECACIQAIGWKPIPPYAANHEMKRTVTLQKAAYLFSIVPHMHFRGKSMRVRAEYPDGRHEELLNVANYQYNWQMNYELAEPKLLPAGTKLVVNAAYDNSTQNKANPDPSRSVPAGEQSWDEMMVGAIALKYMDNTDAPHSNP